MDQWHDYTASEPLTYLGFPLYSFTKQRDSNLNALLDKIRNACNIHSQSLCLFRDGSPFSIRFCPSYSLLNSSLSYLPFTSYCMFSWIDIALMCHSHSKGGLGLLDSHIQQGVSQLRWALPLLQLSLSGESASSY
jgi:hypothetical protein